MSKRVLIPIVGQGSVVHIIRTGMLDKLGEFCTPVVALLWQQDDLVNELHEKGYEVVLIPAYNVSPNYNALRSKLDLWYRMEKVKTPSVDIQKNYLSQFNRPTYKKFKKNIKETIFKLQVFGNKTIGEKLAGRENDLIQQQASYPVYEKWLYDLKIAGLFTVTPFLPEVDLIGRILRKQSIPIIASIHSFDNVTKRGWASTFFDHYIVWNKYNKSELERINPSLKEKNAITVAGAPQFDFHFNPEYTWTKEEWLNRLGLPANKKVILYSGGPVSLLPDEPQYLQHLKDAFDDNRIGDDAVILFRCHPLDRKDRWVQYVGESKHIIYDTAPNGEKKLDFANVALDDIKKLMSTLRYADIHINVVSTMSVDGSAFRKPQIGPYYDEVRKSKQHLLRKMYFQEHYLPIMRSQVVNLAKNKEEYVKLVSDALAEPAQYSLKSEDCLREIITYTDGQSTTRAVEAIKSKLA